MAPIPLRNHEWASDEKGAAHLPGDAPAPRPRRISPKRLIVSIVAFLLTFSLLHRPLGHCYHRVNDHLCRARSIEQRARRVLSSTPLIDGHVDLPILVRGVYKNKIDNDEWRNSFENGPLPGHVDIKRMREGLSGGAFWSLYAPCPENGRDFSDENLSQSVQFTLDQIDLMARVQTMYPDDFSHAQGLNADDAVRAWKEGKFISPFGIEGLHQIGNKASNLRRFHELGVRYATLTHNCHNKFADAALEESPLRVAEPIYHGVSTAGRKLVHEMNRIGMIVDLAHVSEDTMVDILGGKDDWEGSRAPVMYSHSSAYAICSHPRNVKDHVLQMVKERNSVVMVNIAAGFIACEDVGADDGVPVPVLEEATLDRVVEHIMHIGDLIGYDYVGIGTDFDGIEDTPKGLADVAGYPDIVAELLRRGISDEDAGKVVGGNILRVWRDVEEVAARMQAEGAPVLEDEIDVSF
ncbi:hypothetical protein ACO1O0_009306 [Amphichorda felina]